MCEFHSGIVTMKRVFTDLDTDSHSDLLEKYHIKDDFKEANFVKVELVPTNKPVHEAILTPTDKEWTLRVDQSDYPDWWESSKKWAKKEMLKSLKNVIKKRCVLAGQAVKEIKDGERWVIVCGNVDYVYGSATINDVCDLATINDVCGSATINDVRGSATIKNVYGSATIKNVYDSATINDVRGSATINDVRDSATINDVCGSATINDVYGSATINDVYGSATINDVCGSATINDVRDSATIKKITYKAIVIYRYNGVLKIRTGEEYTKIEHTIGGTENEAKI